MSAVVYCGDCGCLTHLEGVFRVCPTCNTRTRQVPRKGAPVVKVVFKCAHCGDSGYFSQASQCEACMDRGHTSTDFVEAS